MRYDYQWHRQQIRARQGGTSAGAIGLMAMVGVSAGLGFAALTAPAPRADAAGSAYTAQFSLCKWGGGTNCVVDGDTFWIVGEKVRVADIDAPETHPRAVPRRRGWAMPRRSGCKRCSTPDR